MNELNVQCPELLLGYVSGSGCYLSSDKCNELSKLWSRNEYDYERLEIERDNLMTENKKLKEEFQKLAYIPLETYTLGEIKDIAMVMRYIAQQALKEVTK